MIGSMDLLPKPELSTQLAFAYFCSCTMLRGQVAAPRYSIKDVMSEQERVTCTENRTPICCELGHACILNSYLDTRPVQQYLSAHIEAYVASMQLQRCAVVRGMAQTTHKQNKKVCYASCHIVSNSLIFCFDPRNSVLPLGRHARTVKHTNEILIRVLEAPCHELCAKKVIH